MAEMFRCETGCSRAGWLGQKIMCFSSADWGSFCFPTDEISPGGKPCTADIGIDLLLHSDPDIYFTANCKRQGPLTAERERFSECIFLLNSHSTGLAQVQHPKLVLFLYHSITSAV